MGESKQANHYVIVKVNTFMYIHVHTVHVYIHVLYYDKIVTLLYLSFLKSTFTLVMYEV